MLARRAGTAHDGNAAGRPEVPVTEVLEAVVVAVVVWAAAKGRARAKMMALVRPSSCICAFLVAVEVASGGFVFADPACEIV